MHAQILLIIGNFSHNGFLAARLQIVLSSCDSGDDVICFKNNSIRHNIEELVQEFEKFVVFHGHEPRPLRRRLGLFAHP